MTDFKFKLEPDDYIIFQLFSISKSEKIQKRIKINRIIVPVIYTIFAVVFLVLSNYFLASLFVALSILWFIYYPNFQKKRYKKFYTRYINANYSSNFEESSNIIIDDTHAYLNSKDDKIKMKLDEIDGATEITSHLFLKFKSESTLIIPKEKLTDYELLKKHIENIIKKNLIEIEVEQNLK